ncbi:hypothetical protein VTO73DRAFT_2576 [Trametes versicolor]
MSATTRTAPRPTPILSKERGRVPISQPRGGRYTENVHFDVTAVPRTPLRIGLRVHIIALTELPNPFTDEYNTDAPCYHAEPTEIEGRIIAIRAMEKEITEFVIKNEHDRSTTKYAYLTVEHDQGVTVHLNTWRRAMRHILLPFLLKTRYAPVEPDAMIAASP